MFGSEAMNTNYSEHDLETAEVCRANDTYGTKWAFEISA